MSEIIVAYWSGTGNTGAMAEYVAQGIREGGKEAKIVNVENFSADELKDCSVFALGCPSMGVEAVSYTHLDVYKRQFQQKGRSSYRCFLQVREGPGSQHGHGSHQPCLPAGGRAGRR